MTEVNQDEPQFALRVNAESFVPKVDKTQIVATACFKNKYLLSTALILVKDKYSEWQTFRALTKEGKYVVSMPLKKEPSCLGNSKDIALKRLGSLWNRLARDEKYLNLYREFLRDYERLGHMKEVTNETEPEVTHYTTHHGIYRPEKYTTKLRVVFNCSSLTDNGISLNDIQYNGGVIQEDLYAQMLWFRSYTYAFTADIKLMYRTILINPKQRNLQRIVWCESEHESPKIYELSTVTYGTVSAPYLAQRTLTQLSMDEEANFPIAASVLRNNIYMDDFLCGAATLEEAIVLRQQLKGILKSAGMELHKLCANHEKLSPDPEQNYNFATLRETKTRILVAFPEVIEIHGFADASERCYGEAVYCKSKNLKSETLVRLITSKSRVAPIKSLTIPRLELCAAVLLAKLVKRVVAALQLETAELYLWSDSMIFLEWLRQEPMDLKTFVQNRVAKIQEFYSNQLWRHVPSDQNPADLVSRGVDPDKLLQQNLWFNGPTFLSGVDFSGPFFIKNKGQRKENLFKVYICTFVCLVFKAVHIELVSDLTSQAFIAALKRFMARRGKCAKLFSDNGKNFVGASNEIKKLLEIVRNPDEK
ncbi:uncharacterized protein TNCV_3176321 [Trichonephila clavipes]|nr:uncharacterized protein TNCV_3176321 [Trichonephila clavipes]